MRLIPFARLCQEQYSDNLGSVVTLLTYECEYEYMHCEYEYKSH